MTTTHNAEPIEQDEAILAAIDDATASVRENVNDERELLSELGQVRREYVAGVPMGDALGPEGQPRLLGLFSRAAQRLLVGGARLRRALIVCLMREGGTVGAVARRLEVTHQRISSIVRRDLS